MGTKDKYQPQRSLSTSYEDYEGHLSKADYHNINMKFMKFIIDKVIDGETIKLPRGCGRLYVHGTRRVPKFDKDGNITGLPPDWASTAKLWAKDPEAKARKEVLFHFNEHTQGVSYRIQWDKTKLNIPNQNIYGFQIPRSRKREMSKMIINGKEYAVVATNNGYAKSKSIKSKSKS